MMKKLLFKLCIALLLGTFSLFIANYIYTKYYYEDDIDFFDASILKKIDSAQYLNEVLYFAESSNGTVANADTCQLSISEMINQLIPVKVEAIDHGAVHAHTFLQLIKNIKADAKVKTLVVTLNMRSFGSPWINSKLETNLAQADVIYNPNLPIIKRIKLAFNGYDNQSLEMRNLINEKNWKDQKINVPSNFPYKTVRQWDNAMANGTYLLPNGNWDMPKITLACHYIKTYAFSIDTLTNPRIKDFDKIVELANEKKLNLVFHLLAENVQYADSLVGKELISLMNQNKQLLIDRYTQKGVTVVNSFNLVNGIDFIDQDWTTEHYNQTGRWILAKNVANYFIEPQKPN